METDDGMKHKFTIKAAERRQWRSGVAIFDFELVNVCYVGSYL